MFQSLKGISGYYNKRESYFIVEVAAPGFNPWKGLVVIITVRGGTIGGIIQEFQSLKGISGYYNQRYRAHPTTTNLLFQSLKGISGYYNRMTRMARVGHQVSIPERD